MLKRLQQWTETHPLADWLISVALGLAVVALGLALVSPGPIKPGLAMLLLVSVLSPPTLSLLRRFSDERRQAAPAAVAQEQGVGALALLASVCGIGAFVACLLGRHWGWPMDRVGPLLMANSLLALLSLGLGQAARFTAAGRWATKLTVGGFALLTAGIVLRLLWLAAGND